MATPFISNQQELEYSKSLYTSGVAEKKSSSIIEELFASRVEKITVCRCGTEEIQETTEMVFPLQYPIPRHKKEKEKENENDLPSPSLDELVPFSTVVQFSMCSEQPTHAWCAQCSKFKSVVSCECIGFHQFLDVHSCSTSILSIHY